MSQKRTIPRVCRTCRSDFLAPPYEAAHGGGLYCGRLCSKNRDHPPIILNDDGLTAQIPLCARDGSIRAYALIDAVDVEWAAQWRWSLASGGYVQRGSGRRDDGRYRPLRLHREILGLSTGQPIEGDHRNRDRLDNRRANLRSVTRQGNAQNVPGRPRTSVHRGVSWNKNTKKWTVRVSAGGRYHYLGQFINEDEAAEVARAARRHLMPFSTD